MVSPESESTYLATQRDEWDVQEGHGRCVAGVFLILAGTLAMPTRKSVNLNLAPREPSNSSFESPVKGHSSRPRYGADILHRRVDHFRNDPL